MSASTLPALPPKPIVIGGIPPTLVRRAEPARRARIWEFNTNLHCSIIGTCLSTNELRHTLKKLGLVAPDSTNHELHDVVVFPVDCISHHAAQIAKTQCQQADKRLVPLRSASVTSLLAALRQTG